MSPTRLLRLVAILGLLFVQLGMLGGHAAMAMPAPAGAAMARDMATTHAGHCPDMDTEQKGRSGPSIDCMIACSSLPAADYRIDMNPVEPALVERHLLTVSLHGLHPESEPPPPRNA